MSTDFSVLLQYIIISSTVCFCCAADDWPFVCSGCCRFMPGMAQHCLLSAFDRLTFVLFLLVDHLNSNMRCRASATVFVMIVVFFWEKSHMACCDLFVLFVSTSMISELSDADLSILKCGVLQPPFNHVVDNIQRSPRCNDAVLTFGDFLRKQGHSIAIFYSFEFGGHKTTFVVRITTPSLLQCEIRSICARP